MAARLRLEAFDPAPAERPASDAVDLPVEEARLSGYEAGYKAGWDDALTAQRDIHDRLSQDLARHLLDLGFTYHEARTRFLEETEVLLRAMTDSVLPDLARTTVGDAVVGLVMSAARQATDLEVVLRIAKADRAAIEAALPPDPTFPLSLVEDPSLEPGQAHLMLGDSEHRLDIGSVVSEIRQLIDTFLTDQELKDASHG